LYDSLLCCCNISNTGISLRTTRANPAFRTHRADCFSLASCVVREAHTTRSAKLTSLDFLSLFPDHVARLVRHLIPAAVGLFPLRPMSPRRTTGGGPRALAQATRNQRQGTPYDCRHLRIAPYGAPGKPSLSSFRTRSS
jgi:hypothetical protein